MKNKNDGEVATREVVREEIKAAINELALIISRSFEAVERRIDRLEARLDERIEAVDRRAAMLSLEVRVGAIEKKMDLRPQ